jgi:malic enzyme
MTSSFPHIPEALTSPSLNRETAFDAEQRRALGLTGPLPSAVPTLEDQAQQLWQQLRSLPSDLARDLLLEVLYFKVLSEQLPELLPVAYHPTVGATIEQYSNEYGGVQHNGATYEIGQPNDFLAVGLGLGVIVAGAQRVTKAMLDAAAKVVVRQADVSAPGAALLPNVKTLRALSAVIAEAVYGAAHADGVATKKPRNVVKAIADTM